MGVIRFYPCNIHAAFLTEGSIRVKTFKANDETQETNNLTLRERDVLKFLGLLELTGSVLPSHLRIAKEVGDKHSAHIPGILNSLMVKGYIRGVAA